MLVVGVVGALVLIDRDKEGPTSGTDLAGAAVILEPTALDVPSPFTASVAVAEQPLPPESIAPVPEEPTEAAPGAGGVVVTASAPGLYGGTRDQQACDPEALVTFLEADPAKAAAWAEVHDIAVADIRSYVEALTPVQLRRDTRVMNYGYEDGRANPYPAVLQAGTAVLVDDYGVPRAKCSCGNPLTEAPAVTSATRYTGARWPGFDPTAVVVVKATVKISIIIVVDITTDRPFGRPVGTTGASDADAPDEATRGTDPTDEAQPSEGTDADIVAEISSIAGVSNGPTKASVVNLPAARITAIRTYHWNNAQGVQPGTISLRSADGVVYGPFSTSGVDGQGGVPNAYWLAVTNFRVPAGSYTVLDSDQATWAWTPDTGGRGMLTIWGVRDEAQAPDRSAEAKSAVRARYCDGVSPYVARVTATMSSVDLYRVKVFIVLDSGRWTGQFDVDFSGSSGPQVRAIDDDSARLIC